MPAPIRRHVLPYSFARSGFFCAEAPADQCNRCGLKAVTERKRKRHNIHADLVCRHRIGSLFGRHDRRHHKADPHENLLRKTHCTRP